MFDKMKNNKNKYLVESARITDAYLSMYRKVNENNYDKHGLPTDIESRKQQDEKLEQFNDWVSKQPVAKIKTGRVPRKSVQSTAETGLKDATNALKAAGHPGTRKAAQITGAGTAAAGAGSAHSTKKYDELEQFNDWVSKQPVAKIKTTEEIEYPENGDIEYTDEEEDYLTGKSNVRPKTLAPNVKRDFIGNIDQANESSEELPSDEWNEDDSPSNEEIYQEYKDFVKNSEPCVETKEGPIYIEYDPERNVLAYGTVTNTGLLEDGNVEYDKNMSMQWNMENVVEEIIDKFGEYEEEE